MHCDNSSNLDFLAGQDIGPYFPSGKLRLKNLNVLIIIYRNSRHCKWRMLRSLFIKVAIFFTPKDRIDMLSIPIKGIFVLEKQLISSSGPFILIMDCSTALKSVFPVSLCKEFHFTCFPPPHIANHLSIFAI